MLAEQGAACDELDAVWASVGRSWQCVTIEEAKNVGRNSDCPCQAVGDDGRPMKFKRCHGRATLDAEDLQAALYHQALVPFGWEDELQP